MTNTSIYYSNPNNLDRSQQVSRVLLAIALLGITVSAPAGVLGWFSILPLAAIYPLVTGLIGWDPIYDVFGIERREDGKLQTASRVELAITGGALIGSAFVLPVAAVFSVFALIGIYPALTALTGDDLLQSVSTDKLAAKQVKLSTQSHVEDSTAHTVAAIEEIQAQRKGKDSKKAA